MTQLKNFQQKTLCSIPSAQGLLRTQINKHAQMPAATGEQAWLLPGGDGHLYTADAVTVRAAGIESSL